MTDRTSFTIAAIDQATEVVRRVETSFERLQKSYLRMAGFLSAGIGVGAFTALMKSTIDAADELNKLSQKTGITVEQLSQLKYAADLNGVGVQALAKGVKALAEKMIEASDSTSKAAKLFKAMGVDIGGGPMKTIEQLAGVFSQLKDGEMKTTLATQLFGKAGMELIPMLNQGTEGLRRLKDEAVRLGIVMSDDMARAAEQFNDNMRAIKASGEGLGVTLLNVMAPSLVRISAAMKAAAEDSGVLMALLVGVGGVLHEAFGKSEAAKLQEKILQYTKEIAVYETKINEARLEGLNIEGALTKAQEERLKFLREELRLIQAGEALKRWGVEDQNDRRMRQGQVLAGPNVGAIRGALTSTSGPSWFEQEMARASKALAVARGELANGTDRLTTSEKKLLEIHKDPEWAKLTPAQKTRINDTLNEAAALERAAKSLAFYLEENKKNIDASEQAGKALEQLVNGLDEQAELLELDARLVGLSNVQREKRILLFRKEGDILAAGGSAAAIRDIEESYARMFAAIDNREFKENQLTFWNQIGDLAAGFANALVNGVGSAFDFLKQKAKQLLAEMIAIFAQRWILQLGASLTGSSALSSAAGQVGQGTITGAVGNWLGSTAIGGMFSGAGSSFMLGLQGGVMTGGTATMQAANAFGTWLNGAAGILSYFAIAIAGAAVAAHQFAAGWRIDNPGNNPGTGPGAIFNTNGGLPGTMWMASQMDRTYRALGINDQWAAILSGSSMASRIFGHRARQQDAVGIRGSIVGGGLTGENWADWSEQGGWFTDTNRGTKPSPFSADQQEFFTNFMRGLGKLTGPLGSMLGLDSTSVLSGYNKPFNFQLNENGEPLTDEAIGKLFSDFFGTVLQEQVAILLHEGGRGELEQYVRNLKGSGEEITAFIQELVGVMGGLQLLNAKGLSVEALMAWQREGESLGQAFERVATQFAQFDDAFMSEAQKLDKAQMFVIDAFAAMGIAIPENSQAFYDLVHGLDLSTEAGRNMFDALMLVAPAFRTVEGAAAAAVQRFNALAGSMSPGFGAANSRSVLEAAVKAWMNLSASNRDGWTVDSTIGNIGALLQSGRIGDALTYAQGLGGNAVQVLNDMLAAYQAWQNAMQTGTGTNSGVTNFNNAANDAAAAAAQLAAQLAEARAGLARYLEGLLVNQSLSPLSPWEQMGQLSHQFMNQVGLARGGDIGAISGLPSYIEQLLSFGREMYGSGSNYVDLFNWVYEMANGLLQPGGGASGFSVDEKLANALPDNGKLASSADVQELTRALRDYLAAVAAGNQEAMEHQNEIINAIPVATANALSAGERR